MGMQDFKNLTVWQDARKLVCSTYRITEALPASERYGLRQQLRRAAVSVPANIAEGCGRGSDPDFARFLRMALASLIELDCLGILASDLGYFEPDTSGPFRTRIKSVRRQLLKLLSKVQAQSP